MAAMGLAYDMLYASVALLTSPVWAYRMARTGKWRTDWPARFGRCNTPLAPARHTLLIHAVSVGEVNAVSRLVDTLDERTHGALRIVVSVTTDTGAARARRLFEPRHTVVRYPFDLGHCVRRFLDTVQPTVVALTELEVWPNFVDQCHRREIPIAVINGRLSPRSFRWYRRLTPLVRPTFSKLTAVAAQTPDYAQRFTQLGVPTDHVRVLDSMKWDTAPLDIAPPEATHTPDSIPGAADLARAMGIDTTQPVIVAGSTGPGEEKLLIDTCPPHAQLVLVPRKPERFDEVASLSAQVVRRTRHPDGSDPPPAGSKLFLVDTMGELLKAYALADAAIVGRSFLGMYGSNPMEPVALGKPTIIGPHHSDFADIVNALRAAEGIVVTDSPGQAVSDLLAHPDRARAIADRGRGVILTRRGATDRHADMLLELMPATVGRA